MKKKRRALIITFAAIGSVVGGLAGLIWYLRRSLKGFDFDDISFEDPDEIEPKVSLESDDMI